VECAQVEFRLTSRTALYLRTPRPSTRSLIRADLWLGGVARMLVRGLADGDGDLKTYRSILRRFVAPAVASSNPSASAQTRS
jgi:hypothetical protein